MDLHFKDLLGKTLLQAACLIAAAVRGASHATDEDNVSRFKDQVQRRNI
jgi:hypothetical protein